MLLILWRQEEGREQEGWGKGNWQIEITILFTFESVRIVNDIEANLESLLFTESPA